MNKTVTLSRDEKEITIRVRQMAHDIPAIVGKKFKYGTGKCWIVKEVA